MAIINPDRIKAESLQFFCATHWGFDLVAVESTADDGLAAVARTKPEFVLVSLLLPDLDAPEILRRIHASSPSSKIIALTTQCGEYLLHQIRASVCHALLLDPEESLASLGEALERARQGLRTVSPRIAQVQTALRTSPDSFPKLLTDREEDVLRCIAHAFTDREIAKQLGCSAGTALAHRRKLMDKLGIHKTPKLIRYCTEKGFNSVPPPAPSARRTKTRISRHA